MNGAVLAVMPTIKQIPMGRVTRLPEWYPDTVGGPFTVYGFVIGHPNGLIVVDAGIGVGNTLIDDLYAPITVDVPQAVAAISIGDGKKIQALALTHLHFDHCGQSRGFDAPTYVQRAEMEQATRSRGYTVSDWIPDSSIRMVEGDVEIAEGVQLVSTPGHTPGHQSVLVSAADGAALILGQLCYRAADFATMPPIPDCDNDNRSTALASLSRIHSLAPRPCTVHFSHDTETASLE